MNYARRCNYIANSYYNKGLELAKQRDLTGAAEALKRALRFNKRQVDARNLLGLVYFEVGEISDAIVQWVLSLNIRPDGNIADRYLGELQRQQGYIDSCAQAILKFNQALALAQGGSDDLAAMQLINITEAHKKYLKAHLLLGLIYLSNEDLPKAYKAMVNVLRIDKGNPLALKCVDDIKILQKQTSKQKTKKSLTTVLTPDKAKNDDYIVPEPYRENTGWQTFVNIFVGILIGFSAVVFLYLPAKEKIIAKKYNEQVISISEKLEQSNDEKRELSNTISTMDADYNTLSKEKSGIDEVYMAKLSGFQKLMGAMRFMQDGDTIGAAKLYSQIDEEQIEDVSDGTSASVSQYYKEIKEFFDGDGYVQLTGYGDKAFEEKDFDTALDLYELSIAVHEDNPAAYYKKGLCYIEKGDRETSNQIFTDIMNKWPDSEIARMAKLERGY